MVPRTIAIVLFALALLVPVLGDELALDDVVALLDMGYGEDEVIVQVQRSGARFDLSPADEERLRRAGASDRLIEALRERPPGAEAVRWLGEVDPNAFETSTRARERFVSSLTIPTDWKEFPGQSAHLFAFEADWIGSGYLGDRKVICQVVLGEATDPARALEAWMRRRIVLAAGESEIETKRSSVAPLPGGGSIASLRLWEKFGFQANFPPLTFLDGYLVRWHGYSLFLGTWWEIDELVVSEEDARETEERLGPEKEAYNAFVQEELLAVAANARFRELPPRNEEWTRRLADLGSFDAEGIHWRFREDGACELWADGHVGVDHRTWYRVRKLHAPTIDDGYPDGREGQLPGRTSYEVRGAGEGDLWIVVSFPDGSNSFHRLTPPSDEMALAIDGERSATVAVHGGIRFQVPKGWSFDSEEKRWNSPESDSFLGWVGPMPRKGDDLGKELDLVLSWFDETHDVVQAEDRMTAGGNDRPPGLVVCRLLSPKARPDERLYACQAAFVVGPAVYAYLYMTPSAEAFRRDLQTAIRDLLDSVAERKRAGAASAPPSGPPAPAPEPASAASVVPFREETRTIEEFCFSLGVPKDWETKEDESKGGYFLFRVPRDDRFASRSIEREVDCEIEIGEEPDLESRLAEWILDHVGMSSRHEPVHEVRLRNVARLPDGGRLAHVEFFQVATFLADVSPYRLLYDGFLVSRDGFLLFMGASVETGTVWVSDLEKEGARILTNHRTFLEEELLAVATNARFTGLPPAQDRWTGYLAEKGSFYSGYSRTSHHAIAGVYEHFFSSWKSESWSFYPDGTCERESDSGHGLNVEMIGPHPTNPYEEAIYYGWFGDLGSVSRAARARYEVRGKDESDLWIFVTHPSGWHSFHRLTPPAGGRGMAIDGEYED